MGDVIYAAIAVVVLAVTGSAGQVGIPEKALTYEVVSVRPSRPDGPFDIRQPENGLSLRGLTVKQMILIASGIVEPSRYGIAETSKDLLISGLPKWAESAKYDVEAKIEEKTAAELEKLPQPQQKLQRQLMLQSVLAERFRLKSHLEPRYLSVYALTIAKGGPKLKEADPNNSYAKGQQIKGNPLGRGSILMDGYLMGQGISVAHLTELLNHQECELDRLVLDKTGLTKDYDIILRWGGFEPGGTHTAEGVATSPASSALSIFAALQEQLGLKLEPTKAAVDAVVVDHVEAPTEN